MDSSEIMTVLTTLANEISNLKYWGNDAQNRADKLTAVNADLKIEIAKLNNELDLMRIQMEELKRG